jgi:hypothetical protein
MAERDAMDEREWTNATPEPGDRIEAEGVTVTCEAPGGAALVSGDLQAALAELAPGAPLLGLGADEPDAPAALQLARDRALVISAAPLELSAGWHAGYAVSPADDLHVLVRLEGARAEEVCRSGIAAPLDGGSPCAAVLFAGRPVIATRHADAIRLRVERPDAAWLWSLLGRLSR